MQIYQSSITKLAHLLLPPRLRSNTLMAIVRAAVTPVEQLRSDLLLKRDDVNYWLGITPQRCYLEKALNDAFDKVSRSITISNGEGVDITLIHTDEALKEVLIGESLALIVHDDSNYSGGDYDFSVNIGDIVLSESDEQHMRSIVNTNKLADKAYVILNQ